MTTFPFNTLPAELRLLIWDAALLNEANNRVVLVKSNINDWTSIYPTKILVSPFLLVNHESRGRAKRFYSDRLRVGTVTKRDWDSITVPVSRSKWVVYLSAKHDTFCIGFDFPKFTRNDVRGHLYAPAFSSWQGVSFCGVTPKDSIELGARTRKACYIIHCHRDDFGEYDLGTRLCPRTPRRDGDRHLCEFPNAELSLAIFFAAGQTSNYFGNISRRDARTNVMAVAQQGWIGQLQHMSQNLVGDRYAVGQFTDDRRSQNPTVRVMTLPECSKFLGV
ncbi:hypothetical protein F5Y08DRAFT_196952 [Xylaria arbuscula]|nr:hypothetical protein F5Y08DRAFT_196952 [Xylaria arbuscula]